MELAADLGITATDAHADPALSELTEGRSELVCLALWLVLERSKVWHSLDRSNKPLKPSLLVSQRAACL